MDDRQDTAIEIRSRKRHTGEGDLDITPMIDITFLLLAFFIVVSKMDPTTQIPMPRAKYGIAVPDRSAVILVVSETDAEEPKVYLGKAKVETALVVGSIEDIEEAVARYVEEELQDQRKTTVIIKGEKKVKYRHLHIVKQAVSTVLNPDQKINIGIQEE